MLQQASVQKHKSFLLLFFKKEVLFCLFSGLATAAATAPENFDVVIRDGEVYDGSGAAPVLADVGVKGDRIAAIAPHLAGRGKTEIDAHGQAVAPGFINMLAHPEVTFMADGRALSDLMQGVTMEVLGEDSMGPLTQAMKVLAVQRQGDIKYPITWTTLGEYLEMLERKGISPNVASFVGASTVRVNLLGEADVQPTPAQLAAMQALVRQAMEQGALGLTDALMYAPDSFAKTAEVSALAKVSAQCGGIYTVHMRSEGDHIVQALQETFDIAEASGAPAEIYHLKEAGRDNWGKLEANRVAT
jgi:N-acyl-D-amino-acid deacylase